MPADRLTAFLYLLMRDHVPTGTVKGVVDRLVVIAATGEELVLSAPELESLAMRYSAALRPALPFDEEPEEDRTGDDGRVMQIERVDGDLVPADPSVAGFTSEMLRWLDEFDDRIEASLHFVQAVNEAAANEMAADEVAARLVGQRVGELTEQAARHETTEEPRAEPAADESEEEVEKDG